MQVTLIQVPYDSGHYDRRMGKGPLHLVSQGLPDHLEDLGVEVETTLIEVDEAFPTENQTAIKLFRQVSRQVTRTDRQGAFPVLLSGNCNQALGSVAGLSPGRLGVIWYDAHSDFRTPARSYDGFLDAMGLAVIAGLCWQKAAGTVPGFRPVPPERILHLGGRLLDSEVAWFNEAGAGFLQATEIQERGLDRALSHCLDEMARHVDRVHVHLDLDVVDPELAPANEYAREHGLTPDQVARSFELIAERFAIAGFDLSSYQPEQDPEGKALQIAFDLAAHIVQLRMEQ